MMAIILLLAPFSAFRTCSVRLPSHRLLERTMHARSKQGRMERACAQVEGRPAGNSQPGQARCSRANSRIHHQLARLSCKGAGLEHVTTHNSTTRHTTVHHRHPPAHTQSFALCVKRARANGVGLWYDVLYCCVCLVRSPALRPVPTPTQKINQSNPINKPTNQPKPFFTNHTSTNQHLYQYIIL